MTERKSNVFSMRLLRMVPAARGPIVANVALQWVALAANVALMILFGLFVQAWFEGVLDVGPWLWGLGCAAAVAIAVRMACLAGAQRCGLAAAQAAKRAVRQEVYDKLVRLGPSYAERVPTAEAVQVSVEGCEQLESYFGQYVPQLFYAVLAPLTLFACLAPLCLPAAAALLACVPLIPLSIVAVQKIAKRVMRTYWGAYTDLGGAFLENLQGLTTLKIYQADGERHARMNEEAETFRRATMRLLRMQLNSVTVMDLFAFGGAAVGIIVALVQFADGQVPLFAAFAVVFLSSEFFIPLRTLGSFFHTAMNGMAAADKMFSILDAPEPERGSRAIDPQGAGVSLRGVGYSYDGERQVLADVDFEAPAGSFTGIVGESGSGKSTLACCAGATRASPDRWSWAACPFWRRRAPRWRARCASCRSPATCSKARCGRTCFWPIRRRETTSCGRRSRVAGRTGSCALRAVWTCPSPSRGRTSREGSGSAWRLPVRFCTTRRCTCSTRPRPTWTRRASAPSWRSSASLRARRPSS